jgi:hypothetical protein
LHELLLSQQAVLIKPLTQQPIAAFIHPRMCHCHASATGFQRNHIACAKLLLRILGTHMHVRSVKSIESIPYCRVRVPANGKQIAKLPGRAFSMSVFGEGR